MAHVDTLETPRDRLSLASGLLSIAAGFLWLWVWILQAGGLETGPLCGEASGLIGHCPLCYPAAAATVGAVVGWAMTARRRLAD
ncbi:MAG: hypothetical protein KF842_01805 [Caulobacter sp.]|nr:hypothetical protein [Caulobacter sp.]